MQGLGAAGWTLEGEARSQALQRASVLVLWQYLVLWASVVRRPMELCRSASWTRPGIQLATARRPRHAQ
eukprot:COSAG04_NODE_1735_length_5750_cov_5.602194_2_plen_69_part_00